MKLDNKKILIVSPHPDDEVIGCGGLLAYAKDKKCEVLVLYMCVGQSRQLITGSTNENIRLKEIENVAREGGFNYQILFIGHEFVRLDTVAQKKLIDSIEDIIEYFKPDIVCIPSPESYNQDHRATYTACITALRPIPRNIRHFVPTVLIFEEPYTWTTGGLLKPNFYLDTTNLEEKKVALMKLHLSQDRPSPFSRSAENLVHQMRIRGSEVGLKSAEAYHLLRGCIE